MFDSPVAATEKIPELKELSKLIKASPNVTKVLSDKNLVATIFAPNNDAVTAALEYVKSNFPDMTTEQLVELGVVDNLLKYHVTAGKAALTSDRLKDGMKLTMLNDEKTTILKKASEDAASEPGRRLLQANESVFIQSNTNQTAAVLDANYQGGKAIIHVIDGVLIPESFAAAYGLQDIPGAANVTADANATAEEPAGGAGNDTATAKDGAAKKGDAAAPASSPKPAPKSAAGIAAAALLGVPALLAALML
jgi:uncharacterized surface protein with fasciclin (FAS1) repeats